MARLAALGLRSVPVVALDEAGSGAARYAFGVDLEAVAELVGIAWSATPALPAGELTRRLADGLELAMELVARVPPQRLGDTLPRRDRTILALANHVVEIAAGLLRVAHGAPFDAAASSAIPGVELAVADLARRADGLVTELRGTDIDPTRGVETFFGPQRMHVVLERCAWHVVQHARQLQMVLDGLGVDAGRRVDEALCAGLPLPEQVWD